MERHVVTDDEDGTRRWGARLAAVLTELAIEALVIDLRGELGAGKTVFVRGLGRALGVPAAVPIVSPTFTIARAYALPGPHLRELHHLDAYRLGSIDELEAAGFEEMCGEGRLTCVEWGSHVDDALPEDRVHIQLRHAALEDGAGEPDHRALTFRAGGPRSERILARLFAEAAPERPA